MGKTAVLKSLLPLLDQSGESPCVCKIDCLQSKDAVTFQKMKYPCVTGLSGDICPDHFLVSNLPELWQWTNAKEFARHRNSRSLSSLFTSHQAYVGRLRCRLYRQLQSAWTTWSNADAS